MKRWLVCLAVWFAHSANAADTQWIEESNRHAQAMLEVSARYAPEFATPVGVESFDDDIIDLKPRVSERMQADFSAAAQALESKKAKTPDPRIAQDLDILVVAARNRITSEQVSRRYLLPFFDLAQTVFMGFQNLIDERVPAKRQRAALIRLKRYIGAEKGYEPVTQLARARYEEAAGDSRLLGPWNVEVQQILDNQRRYLDGVEALLKESDLGGWEADMQTLRTQFDAYDEWVRKAVLPRARTTSQAPAEVYADNLRQFGVDMSPQELIDRASASYVQTRAELAFIAKQIAVQRGYKQTDYRFVLRELKKQRIDQDQLLPFYERRLADLEAIIRRERIVTLPTRKAVIRLATEAESAASPSPHIDPPRLVGNTGEPAEFVLPIRNPNAAPGTEMDDFTYDAIAWTLTAHEARPGHELQFASMLERGVSTARVVFALNSANVEGWALYAEAQMKEHLPLEGQLGVLQMRLMREARAFLDPMVNLGQIQPAEAQRILMDQVLLSEPMAKQEIDRYTFDAPGQATAYFYGYSKLNALRTRTEIALSGNFDQLAFHDFVIAQGVLPLHLLERAVSEDFIPAQRKRSSAATAPR